MVAVSFALIRLVQSIYSYLIQIGKRLMRVAYSRSIVDHPMIPVDVVANMTISAAWFIATNKNLYIL